MHEEKSRGGGLESRKTRLRLRVEGPERRQPWQVGCTGIVVISAFRGRAPKTRRETVMITETSLRETESSFERPVLGGRLLVSGAGPGSSVRKGVRERSGCPGSCGLPRKCVRTCRWSLCVPGFGRESSCGKPVGQNGVLTAGPAADGLTTVQPLRTRVGSALSTQAPGVESSSTGTTEPYFAGPSLGPSINMISICASGKDEDAQDNPLPFVIDYTPEEPTVGFAGHMASSAPFVVDIPAREPYADSKVPWTYEGSIGSVEQQFSVMGRVTEEEAEAFMKIIKASEYKVVEQMAKSSAHISLLALLLGSEPHREALLRVLKEMPPDRIEETVGFIFSNYISFSDDELPFEGWLHSWALHIVCKCNNYIIGRVMIDNGSALNVCPVTTLKQMNVDLNRVRPSKTAVRAFDGSRREVNGEIDLLIDVGPCSFSITFQVLDIPNAFSLLLGRPWIHSAGAVPSFLHQRLKFIVEEKLITVLLCNNYVPDTGLGARGQGISRPIEIEEYKYRRGLGFRPSCHEINEARRGHHLHRLAAHYGRLNRGIPVPPLSRFFPGPSHIIGATLDDPSSNSDDTPATPSAVYAVIEEIPSGVHIRLAQENEELDNWTSVPCYSAVIADV
ncbi:hypothetical protein CRG98_006878 [Punica granatum]|uniref:G-patch domain-containing protein n=1 Tax=Punica granatum TaxID=22663 RepID=A0A2I0KWJ8_PUNGR|nr:hypothetical protein CRG98_006878 [Punica granatum]